MSGFPFWFQVGSYGGLACCMLVGAIHLFGLWRRHLTRRALWIALLSAVAALLLLPALFWFYRRFQPQQTRLVPLELALMLIYVAFSGWVVPLGASLLSLLFAPALPTANVVQVASSPGRENSQPQPPRYRRGVQVPFVFSDDAPWGWLEHRSGKFQGQRLALKRVVATIGRDEDCDIWLDDDMASRHHAELAWDAGRVCLTDCDSRNGTLLSGKIVRGTVLLSTSDLIEIGEHRFLFELAERRDKASDDDPLNRHTWRSARDLQTSVSEVLPITSLLAGGTGQSGSVPVTPPRLRVSDQSGGAEVVQTPPPAPVPTRAIRVQGGLLAGRTLFLDRPVVTLGRDSRCVWVLPDAGLAPLHARLYHRPEGDCIEDVAGGLLLNDQPLQAPQLLKVGDTIRLAGVRLQYLLVQPARATPLPPTLAQDGASTPVSFPSSSPLRSPGGPQPLKLPSRRKE